MHSTPFDWCKAINIRYGFDAEFTSYKSAKTKGNAIDRIAY